MSDKEKIRDKTQEEELDRKIAAIREKNAKIVQRRMEVDADAQASNGSTKPPPSNVKPTSQGTERSNNGVNGGAKRSGKHEWNREWDHGKTPAETWKENVPSMETIDRKPLSSRITRGGGVAARGGGGGRGAGGRGGGPAPPPQKRDGQQSGSNRGPRNENQRSRPGNFHDNRTNGERRITTDGKEGFKIEIKNIDPNKKKQRDPRPRPENGQPRKPRQQSENSVESGNGKPNNNNDAKVRNRNPRSNDRRDVNIVVRMLVNKVVKTLRDEERAANGQENGNTKDEESDDKKESSPETSVDHVEEEEERDDDAAKEQKEEGEETIPTETEPKEEAEVAEPAPVSA